MEKKFLSVPEYGNMSDEDKCKPENLSLLEAHSIMSLLKNYCISNEVTVALKAELSRRGLSENRSQLSTQSNQANKHALLISEDESIKAKIGQSYLDSFLSGESLSKTVIVATEKRLYATGKKFIILGSERIRLTANIKDVNGISVSIKKWTLLQILLSLSFLLMTAISLKTAEYFVTSRLMAASGFIGLILTLVILRPRAFLNIIINGVPYGFKISHSPNEIQDFTKNLSLLIEKKNK